MSDTRMEVEILGHNLGTADGWDDMGDYSIIFYDFKPNSGFVGIISEGDLFVDFNKGVWEVSTDEGVFNADSSIVTLVKRYFLETCYE